MWLPTKYLILDSVVFAAIITGAFLVHAQIPVLVFGAILLGSGLNLGMNGVMIYDNYMLEQAKKEVELEEQHG